MTIPLAFQSKVLDAFAKIFGVSKDSLSEETWVMDDLWADDIDLAELCHELESSFSVELQDYEWEHFHQISEWMHLLFTKVEQQRELV